jgi:hypothetical protein
MWIERNRLLTEMSDIFNGMKQSLTIEARTLEDSELEMLGRDDWDKGQEFPDVYTRLRELANQHGWDVTVDPATRDAKLARRVPGAPTRS